MTGATEMFRSSGSALHDQTLLNSQLSADEAMQTLHTTYCFEGYIGEKLALVSINDLFDIESFLSALRTYISWRSC